MNSGHLDEPCSPCCRSLLPDLSSCCPLRCPDEWAPGQSDGRWLPDWLRTKSKYQQLNVLVFYSLSLFEMNPKRNHLIWPVNFCDLRYKSVVLLQYLQWLVPLPYSRNISHSMPCGNWWSFYISHVFPISVDTTVSSLKYKNLPLL